MDHSHVGNEVTRHTASTDTVSVAGWETKLYKILDSIQKSFLSTTGLELIGKGPLYTSSAQAASFDRRAAQEAGLYGAEINDFARLPVSGDAWKGPSP